MATYTAQVAPHAGATVTETQPAASGNTAPCGAGLGLLIRTTSGPNTVTIAIPTAFTFDGLPIAGSPANGTRSVTVASNAVAIIPLVATTYADPTTGLATFGVSGTLTGVLCSVIAISA